MKVSMKNDGDYFVAGAWCANDHLNEVVVRARPGENVQIVEDEQRCKFCDEWLSVEEGIPISKLMD